MHQGGWYIVPAMEHYRCHQEYLNSTISEIIGDTVDLFPHHTNMSFIYSSDRASLSGTDLM